MSSSPDTKPLFGGISPTSLGSGLFGSTSLFGSSNAFTFGGEPGAAVFGASSIKKNEDGDDDDGGSEGEGNDADESHAAEFVPRVQLSLVEFKTCEEEEEVLLKVRAKLYVFVKEDEYGGEIRKDFWRERGLGEVKILQHQTTKQCRLLMRQEKTLKIAANHKIDPLCELKRNTEKSFVFSAVDFANDNGVGQKDVFSLKFASSELADDFASAFQRAKIANRGDTEPLKPVPASKIEKSVEPLKAVEKEKSPVINPNKSSVEIVGTIQPLGRILFSKLENVFDEQVRSMGFFAASNIGKGKLVRIASAKSSDIFYRLALHILYTNDEVHAHVVTVQYAASPVMVEEMETGRIF